MSIKNIIHLYILLSILYMVLSDNQTEFPSPSGEIPKEGEENVRKTSPEEEKKKKEINNLMQDFNNDWKKKMENYNSDFTYNIPLRPKIPELFYENVTTVPATFKGAFIIIDESIDKIEFMVRDPNNRIIYQVNKHHDVFEIPIKLIGKYSIIFHNKISKSDILITFTMNSGQNKLLNSKDLTKTEEKLESLNTVIKKFNLEFKFGHDIHTKRYQSKFIFI